MSHAISVETKYLPAGDPSLPALALQITRLVDSYMLWVGTTELAPEEVDRAPSQGSLARDWSCAMPAIGTKSETAGPATSLFRSSGSGVTLSMAQRLARKFRKQIFLSVDIPGAFLAMEQGPKLLFEAERGIVETLKEYEQAPG